MAEAPYVQYADLMKSVVKLRDKDGKPWHEIAGELGESAGKVMLAYEMANLPASERVKFKGEADLANKVVSYRDKQKLSWGSMVARFDIPESRLRSIYEAKTGTSTKGNRIGKGGRYPNGVSGNSKAPAKKATKSTRQTKKATAKKAPATKKAVAKKAPAKKTTAKKAAGTRKASGGDAGGTSITETQHDHSITETQHDHPLALLNKGELAQRIEGKAMVVRSDTGNERTYKVKTVRSLANGEVEFTDATTGNAHTVKVSNIRKLGRK